LSGVVNFKKSSKYVKSILPVKTGRLSKLRGANNSLSKWPVTLEEGCPKVGRSEEIQATAQVSAKSNDDVWG